MNSDDQRRVRKLRLHAPDEHLIRRGAILVEDALHCASLPGSSAGLLCVRQISLGRFRCNQSSMNLAMAIEEQLKQYADLAETVEDTAADEAPAVRFHDENEPYLMLIERLIADQPVDAWYWAAAVRCWDPSQPPSVALRRVVMGLQEHESGPVALAHWLRANAGSARFRAVLDVLQESDAAQLLKGIGFTQVAPPAASSGFMARPSWTAHVQPWIVRWGRRDPRSIWLIAMLLIAHTPSRLCDPTLRATIAAVVDQILSDESMARKDLESPEPGPARKNLKPPEIRQEFANRLASSASSESAKSPQSGTGAESPEAAEQKESVAAQHPGVTAFRSHGRTQSAAKPTGQTDVEAAAGHHPIAPHDLKSARDHFPSAAPRNLDGSEATSQPIPTTDLTEASQPSQITTHYAGLFLLVPLLERLAVQAWLEAHPHWIELGMPLWILQDVAARLGAESQDPVMRALSLEDQSPDTRHLLDFVVPERWHEGIVDQGNWSLRETESGTVLLDASQRLPLAFWREPAAGDLIPVNIRTALGQGDWTITYANQLTTKITHTMPWELALRSWRYALRRWCRRFSRMGLHDVVVRFGHVAATKTHIDVFFNHRQADVRLRKSGMDINPGWTPWLGRIITFHYVDGDDEPSGCSRD